MPSGLWHHQHERGHPFMKNVTLIPGPSCIEYLFTLKISPFIKKEIK
jgi:hypothetical protein